MNWMHITLLVQLLLLVPVAFSRPGAPVVSDTAATVTVTEPAAPTPVPTVSTVLANDTAIANQFIDHLNLTDISVSVINRRLHTAVNHQNQAKVPASTVVVSSSGAGKAHHGVAVPMTIEELEAEMASATAKPTVRYALRTTTARDGITTWIPAETTTVKSFGSQKMDKIAKVKVEVASQRPDVVKSSKPNKSKFVPSSPKTASNGTTTTTAAPSTTLSSASSASASPKPNVVKKSPTRPPKTTTTTTTTAASTAADIIAVDIHTDVPPTSEQTTSIASGINTAGEPVDDRRETTKEPPVPFLVLEPKDADFDLPQDRSPGKPTPKKPKRPAKGNGKKKPVNHKTTTAIAIVDDEDSASIKNSTKSAVNTKLKQKPMTTQIYNYLSREIMPTVGVGLLGLVVTAGIAGYFLNPLGALRRSYEVADRKDDLYHYNNEEYAGSGPSDGQSEEEIFGKVIAGMPVHSTYRNNIRYVQPAQQQQQQQSQPQYRHPNQYSKPYSVGGGGASGPPAQYSRYRNVQHMQSQVKPQLQQQPQQHPGHYAAYAAHYGQQRNTQQLSPNVLIQKSIASSMYAQPQQQLQPQQQQQQQQHPEHIEDRVVTPPASITVDHTPASEPITQSSSSQAAPAQSADTATSTAMPSVVFSYTDRSYTDQYLDTNPNELRRRSQFVVGSVVLADAQAAALTAADPADAASNYPSVVLPEHGPRRRRRRSLMPMMLGGAEASEAALPLTTTDDADIVEGGPEGRSFDLNIGDAEAMYEQLRSRFEQSAPPVRGDKQLLKEMKRLDYQVTRLRRVVAEAKDIEQFQSELSLEPKNGELHDTLNNGLVQITSDIRFVGELLDDPKMIGEKIADRQMMSKRMALTALVSPKQVAADRADDANVVLKEGAPQVVAAEPSATVKPTVPSSKKTHHMTTTSTSNGANGGFALNVTHSFEYTTTPRPSFFLGLLKMLELKSAFGVNVLRSIRPAFDRAVADVFRVNQTMYNHN